MLFFVRNGAAPSRAKTALIAKVVVGISKWLFVTHACQVVLGSCGRLTVMWLGRLSWVSAEHTKRRGLWSSLETTESPPVTGERTDLNFASSCLRLLQQEVAFHSCSSWRSISPVHVLALFPLFSNFMERKYAKQRSCRTGVGVLSFVCFDCCPFIFSRLFLRAFNYQ